MWIFVWLSYVMFKSIFIAIEYVISTASDVDGINESVFAEGIGKVPEGFLVAGGDEIELVAYAPDGSTFHLAMQEETAWYFSIANEDKLAEE